MRRAALIAGLCGVAVAGTAALVRETVGPLAGGGWRVATGQVVRPIGRMVTFAGRPVDLALTPNGATVVAKDTRGIVVVDARTATLRQELSFPSGGGSLHGIAIGGGQVYATDSGSKLWIASPSADGRYAWKRSIPLPGPPDKSAAYGCGIALAPDAKTALVCLSRANRLAVIDLARGRVVRTIATGIAPFAVVFLPGGRHAAVSNWGGRFPRPGETTADSAGTAVPVDRRGVGVSGTVSIVEIDSGKNVATVPTGRHPSALALSPDGRTLATADANDDTVTLIDIKTRTVSRTVRLRTAPDPGFGAAPTGVAFAADGKTLLVSCGGRNAVAVIQIRDAAIIGWIPVGWYPGAVALAPDRRTLWTADVKGIGSRGKAQHAGHGVYDYAGALTRTPIPTGAALAAATRQADADARIAHAARARTAKPSLPPVEHVVYILKENRTYDQVFGDLPQGDGDPSLCLYGREITPNHHALAEQFVLLDNFYCNGVLSADGHSWATEANVTDHLEKAFGGFVRSYTFGDDALTYSSSGFLWDNVLDHGKTFVNFGEMDYASASTDSRYDAILKDWQSGAKTIRFTHKIGVARLKAHSHPQYPGWNMDIPDVVRADIFLAELARWERSGTMPNLTLIYLPNDHTTGATPGDPTARSYMADNDLALGRIVDGISHSRFWPKTAIFVLEDDPQDGFDHIDGHRSLCLVIGPHMRRGAVVSDFFNQSGAIHTMQRLLGLAPMNLMDAASPLMTACFQPTADLTPYTALPNTVPLAELVPPRKSARAFDFSRPDGIDDDALNRVLWHAAKGDTAYPAHLAGAHGRGLAARGLLAHRPPDNDDR
jgi:YVTN family beta-propeller protein